METREEKRNILANNVCSEVRYQLSNYGCITDNDKLFKVLSLWMMYIKKDQYNRPQIKH